MSTDHKGEYCQVKDKMVLTEREAIDHVKRVKGVSKYRCKYCGGWHLTSTKHNGMRPGK